MSMVLAMPPELVTERLRMRPWRVSDAEAYRALWAERDPRSVRVIDAAERPTVADLRARITAQLRTTAETGLALLAVDRQVEGDFIGYCGLIVGSAAREEPELAFELSRRAHGRGYATEAARAVVAAAAGTGRSRLWATVRSWNARSVRVLDKLDFQPSGKVTEDPDRGDLVWMTRRLTAGGHRT